MLSDIMLNQLLLQNIKSVPLILHKTFFSDRNIEVTYNTEITSKYSFYRSFLFIDKDYKTKDYSTSNCVL